MIPTSDVLRDQQIADEMAAVEQVVFGGFEYMSRPDAEQRSAEIFADLRGGVPTPETAAAHAGVLPGDQVRAAAGNVSRSVSGAVQKVRDAAASAAAGLGTVGTWVLVGLGLVAAIVVVPRVLPRR